MNLNYHLPLKSKRKPWWFKPTVDALVEIHTTPSDKDEFMSEETLIENKVTTVSDEELKVLNENSIQGEYIFGPSHWGDGSIYAMGGNGAKLVNGEPVTDVIPYVKMDWKTGDFICALVNKFRAGELVFKNEQKSGSIKLKSCRPYTGNLFSGYIVAIEGRKYTGTGFELDEWSVTPIEIDSINDSKFLVVSNGGTDKDEMITALLNILTPDHQK